MRYFPVSNSFFVTWTTQTNLKIKKDSLANNREWCTCRRKGKPIITYKNLHPPTHTHTHLRSYSLIHSLTRFIHAFTHSLPPFFQLCLCLLPSLFPLISLSLLFSLSLSFLLSPSPSLLFPLTHSRFPSSNLSFLSPSLPRLHVMVITKQTVRPLH